MNLRSSSAFSIYFSMMVHRILIILKKYAYRFKPRVINSYFYMVWWRQTMVCCHQTIVSSEQTIVCRQQTIDLEGLRLLLFGKSCGFCRVG